MKFLIDNMLSVLLPPALSALGHDAIHVRDLQMAAQPDVVLLNYAAS